MNAIPLILMEGATISPNHEKVVNAKLQVTDPVLKYKTDTRGCGHVDNYQ